MAEKYGVLRSDGRSERALFIIDKEGIIRYIDIHDIDDQPDNEILRAELRRIDPKAGGSAPFELKATELPHGGIVMYCANWCPDCKDARAWLRERKLEYVEVDVNAIPAAAAQVRQWADGNLVTPTFEIDGAIVIDFDKEKLAKLLA